MRKVRAYVMKLDKAQMYNTRSRGKRPRKEQQGGADEARHADKTRSWEDAQAERVAKRSSMQTSGEKRRRNEHKGQTGPKNGGTAERTKGFSRKRRKQTVQK